MVVAPPPSIERHQLRDLTVTDIHCHSLPSFSFPIVQNPHHGFFCGVPCGDCAPDHVVIRMYPPAQTLTEGPDPVSAH